MFYNLEDKVSSSAILSTKMFYNLEDKVSSSAKLSTKIFYNLDDKVSSSAQLSIKISYDEFYAIQQLQSFIHFPYFFIKKTHKNQH